MYDYLFFIVFSFTDGTKEFGFAVIEKEITSNRKTVMTSYD